MDDQRQGARPEYVRQALEASLHRLGTEYVDLYQLHRPDPAAPVAETLGALQELVRMGKVREIGCSNFSAAQLREADQATERSGRPGFVSVQNQYSLMHREPEAEVIPYCAQSGKAFLPYFPLANGLLSGKYRLGGPVPPGSRAEAGFGPKVFTEANLRIVESLIEFAAAKDRSLWSWRFRGCWPGRR